MVLLIDGTPLTWEETKALAEDRRQRAIKQYIYRWHLVKDVTADPTVWGDELECTLVKFDHEQRTVKALLKAEDTLKQIDKNKSFEEWSPEFTSFMFEGSPRKSFKGLADCAEKVEENYRKRRVEIDGLLESDETIMTLAAFPLLGCQDFTYPSSKPDSKHSLSGSIMFPDQAICDHISFQVLTRNITNRRGREDKPTVLVPVFRDENTPNPFRDYLTGLEPTELDLKQLKDDHIYLDGAPCLGSCCSLQVTTQCKSFDQAIHLRDQLIALCPIVLAITAATPIFRGVLADTDVRWNVLRHGLDDRTAEERGETPLLNKSCVIPCGRVDSVDMYISDHLKHLNDFPAPYNLEAYDALRLAEVNPKFAEEMAHLLIRDPLALYKEQLSADDHDTIDDFEGFHLFHWRTVRVKIPPKDGSSGWKVEFRPIEIQLIESQNAAFAVFAFLISQLIQDNTTQFAIPISKVFSNMTTAQKRDAVTKGKFWWRKSVSVDSPDDFVELSVNEIINGKSDIGLPGVAALVDEWVDRQTTISKEQKLKLHEYVSLVRRRADGSSKTNARWMRDYVRSHTDYRKDSIVPQCVVYDMLKLVHDVNWGKTKCPDLVD